MTGNYSALQMNLLRIFDGDEWAQKALLWAMDRPSCDRYAYKAEDYAHEVKKLRNSLAALIPIAGKPHGLTGEQEFDLIAFIMKRHAVWRWGEQSSYWCNPETFIERYSLANTPVSEEGEGR